MTDQDGYVRSFDHERFAAWPEYVAAADALDRLGQRLDDERHDAEDVIAGRARWAELAADLARVAYAGDSCSRCSHTDPSRWVPEHPYRAEVEDDRMRGHYRCRNCGLVWTCSYATYMRDWGPRHG